jgi:predicted dehydrogenase
MTIRVGVIGFGHMHINDVLRQFNELPDIEWVAAADTPAEPPETTNATFTRAWNARYAHETIGIPKSYPSYAEMLDREAFDVVLVYSENARHAEVVEAIAAHGCAIVVEKPMADSLPNAVRMARAAQIAGVELFVNWPSTWQPAIRTVGALIARGAIGRIHQVKYRGGHNGPLGAGAEHQGVSAGVDEVTDADRNRSWWYRAGTGGGALLDYTSYAACLAQWFFGEPATAAVALAANLGSPFAEVEDNAAVLVRFPSGIALCEGSWTQVDAGVTPGPIVYGETGTMVVQRDADHTWLELRRGPSRPVEIIAPEPLPAGRHNIAQEIVHHVRTGDPVHETLEIGFNLLPMAILDAALKSVRSGQLELVGNAHWV